MSRSKFAIPGAAILYAVTLVNAAIAEPTVADQAEGRVKISSQQAATKSGVVQVGYEVQQANVETPVTSSAPVAAGPASGGGAPPLNPYGINVGQYPQLNAPLYPSPTQNVPQWTGGTIITNQAFAPHELLYPHEFHSMYGPFHYQVKGCWLWTPFGMRQHEKWKLQGTEVRVKYRSSYKLFSGFCPPH